VAQSGVGAEKYEQIGEAADGDAEISGHALSPGLVNFYAALPHHTATNQRLRGAKACAIDQDIDRTLDAVACDDAMRADFGDSIRDEFDVSSD